MGSQLMKVCRLLCSSPFDLSMVRETKRLADVRNLEWNQGIHDVSRRDRNHSQHLYKELLMLTSVLLLMTWVLFQSYRITELVDQDYEFRAYTNSL